MYYLISVFIKLFCRYNYMKLLELFSGTGSVGAVAKDLGYSVVSLDLKNADINCDILNWDYKKYALDIFNLFGVAPHVRSIVELKLQVLEK